MHERLILFETAKLAKEKSFNIPCFSCYDNKGYIKHPFLENGSSTDTDFRVDLDDLLENHNHTHYSTNSAPTQSLLQKWIREAHGIHIEILLSDEQPHKHFYYRIMQMSKYFTLAHDGIYNISYEDITEIALQDALKRIK